MPTFTKENHDAIHGDCQSKQRHRGQPTSEPGDSREDGLNYGATFEIRPIDEESLKRQSASISKWRAAGTAPRVDADAVRFASLGYINETGSASKSKSEFEAM